MNALHHTTSSASTPRSRVPTALIFSSLLFIFSSTSALAGWVPPDARPFVAATVQTSRVDDGGLAEQCHDTNGRLSNVKNTGRSPRRTEIVWNDASDAEWRTAPSDCSRSAVEQCWGYGVV